MYIFTLLKYVIDHGIMADHGCFLNTLNFHILMCAVPIDFNASFL